MVSTWCACAWKWMIGQLSQCAGPCLSFFFSRNISLFILPSLTQYDISPRHIPKHTYQNHYIIFLSFKFVYSTKYFLLIYIWIRKCSFVLVQHPVLLTVLVIATLTQHNRLLYNNKYHITLFYGLFSLVQNLPQYQALCVAFSNNSVDEELSAKTFLLNL